MPAPAAAVALAGAPGRKRSSPRAVSTTASVRGRRRPASPLCAARPASRRGGRATRPGPCPPARSGACGCRRGRPPRARGSPIHRPARAGAGRDGELGRLGRVGRGLEDAPLLLELGDQFVRLGDRVWAWSATMITACVSRKRSMPPHASTSSPKQRSACAIEAGDASGPQRWEWWSLSGRLEEEEVVGVVLYQLLRDAGRVLVARAGPGEGRLAGHGARAVELAVEELVRALDAWRKLGRDGAALQQALEADLVAPAAAVDQERRARGAHPGVAQRSKKVSTSWRGGPCSCCRRCRRWRGRGRTRASPRTTSRTRRSAARPGGTSSSPGSNGDRPWRRSRSPTCRPASRTGTPRRSLDQVAPLDQRAEVGRLAGLDGLEELVGAKGVDEDEAELLGLGLTGAIGGPRAFRPNACGARTRGRRSRVARRRRCMRPAREARPPRARALPPR